MATADLLAFDQPVAPAASSALSGGSVTVRVTHRLDEVEAIWRGLAAGPIESPGQDFGFTRLWIETLGIAQSDQIYVSALEGETPLALFALHRHRTAGVRVLSWFPGAHVGCNAPLVDRARLATMTPDERRSLWRQMLAGIRGADLVHLKSVPRLVVDGVEIFAELGQSITADTLYRAAFVSFEDADSTQRNKSRRKHDRQQGDKLAAMGPIEFDTLDNGAAAEAALDVLLRQRALRFREMGVADPFATPAIRAFYQSTVRSGSGVHVKLHVLKLKGEVIAMRYNIVAGDRLFCLISSMSEDERLRPGSPGKQCLLRVMQSVFAEGYRVFDMGEGLTDEKRHWCNVQVPVDDRYVPISVIGGLAASTHRGFLMARTHIKSDPRLLAVVKKARGIILGLTRRRDGAAAQLPSGDE